MTLLAALRRFVRGRLTYSFATEAPVTVAPETWRQRVGPGLWGRIGFAFQRPELIRALDVADNLTLAMGNGVGPSLFDDDEWKSIAHSRVWEISGGQIQRLGLMRAFGVGQDLIFLDEPTNNLDRRNRSAVADYVAHHRRERSLVLVSHDDDFIDTVDIDRVFEIREKSAPGGGIHRTLVDADQVESQ
jgi:ABC-type lipoprotein export system ATPase subunit